MLAHSALRSCLHPVALEAALNAIKLAAAFARKILKTANFGLGFRPAQVRQHGLQLLARA